MITLPHKEANHLNLIENSTNSPTLDLFDFYPVYDSESCMHCFESSSCLQNYHIHPIHHHLPSSEDLSDFKPLFSTLESSFLDQDDSEEWLEPFPLEDEESEALLENECGCSDVMSLYDDQIGCNCRVLNWLLEEYKQKRLGNNFESKESLLCLLDAPIGSYHALVALIEEYLELNAIPSENFDDLCNFVMFNQTVPKPQSTLVIDSITKTNHNNDIITNMSKALAYSLLCSSNTTNQPLYIPTLENKLGESPSLKKKKSSQRRAFSLKNYFKNRNQKIFVSIPKQLFPSLEFIFYTLQGKQQELCKQQKLAIKQQEEEEKAEVVAEESAAIILENQEKIKEEEEENVASVIQAEQVRYRLVKKSDIRREALNSSCLSSVSSYNTENYQNTYRAGGGSNKNSPKPTFLLENFLSSITEDHKDDYKRPVEEENSSDEDRLLGLELGLGLKKQDNKEDEENAEVETRAGSQKEQESLLQQFDGFSEFTIKTSSIIEKTRSNSDSKDTDNEDNFEERFSQVASETIKLSPPNRQLNDIIFQENDGFIQIVDKRKAKKKREDKGRREGRGYDKPKYENNKKQEAKKPARETTYQTVVYEAKNKSEGAKAKIIVPIPSKASPIKPTTAPSMNSYPSVIENSKVMTGIDVQEKPKRKALSIKSACLDVNIIKTTKVKEFVKKYCEKKFDEDLTEHVAKITEESNKMMDYRMLVHNRIDYCLQKVFEGINIQTKIFGSCATGLALPTSDVDICLCGLPTYSRNEVIQYITTIYEKLKKFKWVSSIKQILTSNVPIVKLEIDPTIDFGELHEELDEYSLIRGMIEKAPEELNCLREAEGNRRIKIDLSIENISPVGSSVPHLGYRTTEFVQKMLNDYDSLYVVAIYLKDYLTKRGFLDNYQGGISSYCLVIMIVAIFRRFTDEGGMKSLKRVLNFYGEEFEPEKTGISVVGAEPFFALNYSFEQVPLWILDNANFAGRSLGQGAFGIKRIFQEFAKSMTIVRKTQAKMETLVLKHKEKIENMQDIDKIDDAELKELINMNIADKLMFE